MPRFFWSAPPYVTVASWLGWHLGSGIRRIAREGDYMAHRARTSSETEKSAWLLRLIVSCGLVTGEVLLLNWLSFGLNSIPTLLTSWCVLFLFPRPTPRVPLFAGRFIAGLALLLNLNVAHDAAKRVLPALNRWDGLIAIVWWLLAGVLVVWAFKAFWRRVHRTAQSTVTAAPIQATDAGLSCIPAVRFEDVGGFEAAKREVEAIGKNRFGKNAGKIVRNGILLYGPQGTGKNLLAEATAGEFRASFYHVRCPELMGLTIGSTSAEIRRVFEWAAAHRPVVLFLDEIDSIGSRKQPMGSGSDAGGAGREFNTVTTQLMQSIDRYRNLDGFLMMAATNHLDGLEPTLIRDGRFDVKLRLDLPDEEARRAILAAQLSNGAWRKHDLSAIARRTPGWSPARLKSLVDRATLLADGNPVEEAHLVEALEKGGGRDRPALERVTWDDVVLPARVVEDLKTLLRLMEPGAAERLSLPSPTGLILLGAPGMGKTLTARLIASQSNRSFYSITPSDILSGAVGGSVKRLSEIFARAKEHAPSILFFDEMDGLFPGMQGPMAQHDVQLVEQALIEISTLKPENDVFLIGTTNYLERVDPRMLRGGRFNEKIEIGFPDETGYRLLVGRYLGKARLAASVTPETIINRIQGMSPADLEATISTMKRAAMRRMRPGTNELPPLQLDDLEVALDRLQPRF
ncbi:MAG: AAA family ATPase [Bryobacteraceae bacterium]